MDRKAKPDQLAQLAAAELALNTYDGKLYFKKTVGGVDTMLTLVGQNVLGSNSPMWTTDTAPMWTPKAGSKPPLLRCEHSSQTSSARPAFKPMH